MINLGTCRLLGVIIKGSHGGCKGPGSCTTSNILAYYTNVYVKKGKFYEIGPCKSLPVEKKNLKISLYVG